MTITRELIAAILGGIVLIGNAVAVVRKWLNPAISMKKKVETIEEDITEIQKHEKKDLEAIEHLQEMNKLQCQAMLCIINHMIDGNNISNMKETRENIQALLVKM